jgi:type II secretory pathway component PulK
VDRSTPRFAAIAAVVAERAAKPFDSKAALVERLRQDGLITINDLDVTSQWFSVRVSVRQDDVQLGTEALVKREPAPDGTATVIWRRTVY